MPCVAFPVPHSSLWIVQLFTVTTPCSPNAAQSSLAKWRHVCACLAQTTQSFTSLSRLRSCRQNSAGLTRSRSMHFSIPWRLEDQRVTSARRPSRGACEYPAAPVVPAFPPVSQRREKSTGMIGGFAVPFSVEDPTGARRRVAPSPSDAPTKFNI